MIRTAVILAAGMGKRLENITKEKPKGFIVLGDKPIIEESILNLIELGIENIVIGTGFHHEFYQQLEKEYSQVRCIYNPDFESTNSLHTLAILEQSIQEDFILLESDLIYEKKILKEVLSLKHSDVILSCPVTNKHDQVYIQLKQNKYLLNMSKDKEALSSVDSEFVGISKLSLNSYKILCQHSSQLLALNPLTDYETALVHLAIITNVAVHSIRNLLWYEIDDIVHLHQAITTVYPKIKAKEQAINFTKKNILLNPGPATTTDRVKHAQIVPDICPREKEFGEIMQFISNELTSFVGDPDLYTTILFGGSGTAAVESVISSVIGSEEEILIINNGAYGKRMYEIAKTYGLNVIEYTSPPDQSIDLNELRNRIGKLDRLAYLAVVHHETSTGLLNDIETIGEICKGFNIQLIVDAMSSFGAIPIDMERMNISYLISSSNKNLQGLPGVSFVIANQQNLNSTKDNKPRNYYLNLYAQYNFFQKTKQLRFTPPVQTIYALKEAIMETKQEGIETRYNRYKKSWELLISGLKEFGLSYIVPEPSHSKIVTSILIPNFTKFDFDDLHDYLYEKGITIYPGKLNQLNTFRVATMGAINSEDIRLFLSYFKDYLIQIGFFAEIEGGLS